jgi:hypothetical protein
VSHDVSRQVTSWRRSGERANSILDLQPGRRSAADLTDTMLPFRYDAFESAATDQGVGAPHDETALQLAPRVGHLVSDIRWQ